MAAMLLSCASAFAQSGNTPAKGDVNEDGTVDVADIVNVIKIMKEGGGAVGEKTYYWYAGTNNGNAVTADNFTDVASRIPESEVPETGSITANGQFVYFVMPEAKHIESLTDGNGTAVEFTCTDVMGYHIYKTTDKINGSINYSVIQTVYYWYVGQNESDSYITSSNYQEIANQDAFDTKTINMTQGNYLYVVVPSDKSVTITDGGNVVTMNFYNTSTSAYNKANVSSTGTYIKPSDGSDYAINGYYLIRTRGTAAAAEKWTVTLTSNSN